MLIRDYGSFLNLDPPEPVVEPFHPVVFSLIWWAGLTLNAAMLVGIIYVAVWLYGVL